MNDYYSCLTHIVPSKITSEIKDNVIQGKNSVEPKDPKTKFYGSNAPILIVDKESECLKDGPCFTKEGYKNLKNTEMKLKKDLLKKEKKQNFMNKIKYAFSYIDESLEFIDIDESIEYLTKTANDFASVVNDGKLDEK